MDFNALFNQMLYYNKCQAKTDALFKQMLS